MIGVSALWMSSWQAAMTAERASGSSRGTGSANILLLLIGAAVPLLPLVIAPVHEYSEYLLHLG